MTAKQKSRYNILENAANDLRKAESRIRDAQGLIMYDNEAAVAIETTLRRVLFAVGEYNRLLETVR